MYRLTGVPLKTMTILAHHRSASFHYELMERFEAGLVLKGSEVKSLRLHRASLNESYLVHHQGELWVHHLHIAPYTPAHAFGHIAGRAIKILLHRRQIKTIVGSITRKGMTAIPIKMYINKKGLIKMEICLAVGKKLHDKRHSIKEKEWNREKHRTLRQKQMD